MILDSSGGLIPWLPCQMIVKTIPLDIFDIWFLFENTDNSVIHWIEFDISQKSNVLVAHSN